MASALLTLAALGAAPALSAPAIQPESNASQPAADLPSGKEVIDHFIEAIGGAKAIKKHKSMQIKGSFAMPSQGMEASLLIRSAAPNLFLLTIDMADIGQVRQGYNGTVGWSIDFMAGPRLVSKAEMPELIRQADFYAELNYDKHFKTIETVGKEQFNERPCYKVRLVDAADKETFQYFDSETGLLAGSEGVQETQMGPIKVKTLIDEYKDFDGRKVAVKTTQKVMGAEQVFTIESIEFDTVPKETFELPVEIKTLVKAESEKQGQDQGDESDENDGDDDDDGDDGGG